MSGKVSLSDIASYYIGNVAIAKIYKGTKLILGATLPTAPISLSLTPGNEQITLSWTAPTAGFIGAITSYSVMWGVNDGTFGTPSNPGNAQFIDTGSTSTTYTKTGLTNGTNYAFRVAAINSAGTGDYSNKPNATPSSSSQAYTDSLLLYPFDSDANDASSTGNDLTLTNASIDTSVKKYGAGSLKFTNSLSNHKAQGSMPSLGTGNFTVEFWLRLASAAAGNKYIVDRGAGSNFAYTNPGWAFYHNGTGSFIWNVKDSYDSEEEEYTTSVNLSSTTTASSSTGSFIHVALVRQGTTYRLYIDGTQEASATGTATDFGVHNFSLGDAMVNGGGIAQNSYIDDFRLSSTAVYPDGTSFTPPSSAHPTS